MTEPRSRHQPEVMVEPPGGRAPRPGDKRLAEPNVDIDKPEAKRARPTNTSAGDTSSDAALLYRFACESRQAANRLLPQAFVPVDIEAHPTVEQSPLRMPHPHYPDRSVHFFPDPDAAARALDLLVIAVDALAIALALPNLSDRETTTIGLLFCHIGFQIIRSQSARYIGKGKHKAHVNSNQLLQDVKSRLAQTIALVQSAKRLEHVKHEAEILNIRLLLFEGKHNAAKQQAKVAYKSTDDVAHQYAVQLLLLESTATLGASTNLVALEEIMSAARHNKHPQLFEAASLARVWTMFQHRRCDLLPAALAQIGSLCGWDEKSSSFASPSPDSQWSVTVSVHYLLYRCLWEGRMGRLDIVKRLRQVAFRLMDHATDTKLFQQARAWNGLQLIRIAHDTGASDLMIQTTPPNILYMMTFLVAMTTGRDVTGREHKAKTLVYSNGLRRMEHIACSDDIWDTRFSITHDLRSVNDSLKILRTIQAEAMLEQSLALAYRSNFSEARSRLLLVTGILHDCEAFGSIGSHVILLAAQQAHLLGQQLQAERYYSAGSRSLLPGSDLGLSFSIGLLGNRGAFDSPSLVSRDTGLVQDIIRHAKSSSSPRINALGLFISGLAEAGVSAKTKMRSAWEATHANGDKILYALLFAFLASIDVSSDTDRLIEQAKTGKELARAMGGLDRPDGVGQGSLGMWYAIKLSKLYRVAKPEGVDAARKNIAHHAARNKELSVMSSAQIGMKAAWDRQ